MDIVAIAPCTGPIMSISCDPHLRVARPTDHMASVLRFYVDGLGFETVGSFTGHHGFDGVMLAPRGARAPP
jgi:hypothetical protein